MHVRANRRWEWETKWESESEWEWEWESFRSVERWINEGARVRQRGRTGLGDLCNCRRNASARAL